MNSNPMPSAQAQVIRDSVLKAENLSKQVSSPEGPLTIVHGVSLDIAAGESVAIVGSSGAGKSTLLALLAGLDLPTTGRVLLEGTDLTQLDEDGRARLRAQLVWAPLVHADPLPHRLGIGGRCWCVAAPRSCKARLVPARKPSEKPPTARPRERGTA